MKTKKRRSSKKQVVKTDTKISFSSFFNKKVKENVLGFWQRDEIEVFFKEKGLSDREDKDKYEEILKLY